MVNNMHETEKTTIRALVANIERLEQDKSLITERIRDVYTEAKDKGYDVKILKKLIQIRKQDAQKIEEEQELLDLYQHALENVAKSA